MFPFKTQSVLEQAMEKLKPRFQAEKHHIPFLGQTVKQELTISEFLQELIPLPLQMPMVVVLQNNIF